MQKGVVAANPKAIRSPSSQVARAGEGGLRKAAPSSSFGTSFPLPFKLRSPRALAAEGLGLLGTGECCMRPISH